MKTGATGFQPESQHEQDHAGVHAKSRRTPRRYFIADDILTAEAKHQAGLLLSDPDWD
jgi:hypothetical protein